MAKHALKILWCSHRKIFKVCLAIFQHYERKVYQHEKHSFLNLEGLKQECYTCVQLCQQF